MALMDLFDNGASQDAFRNNQFAIDTGIRQGRRGLNTGYQDARAGIGRGLDALRTGINQGRQDIMGGYRDASGALGSLGRQLGATINQGAATARGDLTSGFSDARQALSGGYQDQRRDLTQVANSYNPLIRAGSGAGDAYYNAIGANGAAGSEAAQAAFRAGPGYQFQMDQGLDAVMRSAAARGSLAGGNTDVDLMRTGQGIADQEWDDYITNLGAGVDRYKGALDSRGAALTNRANAAQAYGQNSANLAAQRGAGLASLEQAMTGLRAGAQQAVGTAQANAAQQRGTSLAALSQAGATGAAGLYGQGAGQSMQYGQGLAGLALGGMNATTANNNALAQSENQQSQNLWGGLLGLGSLALSPLGGAAGTAAAGAAQAAGQPYNPFMNTVAGQGYNYLANRFA